MSKKAAASDKDRFDDLTDDLIRHVLSFLPGDDALQTCVLDTRWRDIWRRTTSLRFMQDEWSSYSRERFKQLVKLTIQLRGNSLLTDCQITPWSSRYILEHTKLLKYVLDCQVQKLLVCSHIIGERLLLKERLISQHLRIIEFFLVDFKASSVNFSRCPVLEELSMEWCKIHAHGIFSKSLKHLQFSGRCSFPQDFRIHIDAPCLTSLLLEGFQGLTPFLEKMPLLETASVVIWNCCLDSCESNREDFNDPSCTCCDDECVLLNGLSDAADLELLAEPEKQFIYRWDLAWCPIFAKLKTLVLNEWFTAIDLVCILQHSPVLEILTLKLLNTKNLIGTTEGQEIIEQPFVCAHLKVVNIEVEEVDEGVRKILKILRTCGVLRDHISIKPPSLPSDSSYSDSDASSSDSD